MTTHGYFRRENGASVFVLTQPDTPRPWQHYLINETMLVQLDQYASGTCRYWDEKGNDVSVISAPMRRTLVVREPAGRVWSPAIYPGGDAPPGYRCEYAPAYWRASGQRRGVFVSWQIAVPVAGDFEMWRVEIANRGRQAATRDLFFYVPVSLMGFSYRHLYRFYSESNRCFLQGHFEPDLNAVWIANHVPGLPHALYSAYLACDAAPQSYDTFREEFTGPSDSVLDAKAIRAGCCGNSLVYTGETCLALHFRIALAPGAAQTLRLLLGVTSGRDHLAGLCRRHLAADAFDAALREVEARRGAEIARVRIATAVPAVDSLADTWAKCQNRLGVLHRKGFRDVLQDSSGMTLYDPDRARAGMEEAIAVQKADGRGIRAWKPYVDAEHYSDGQYWMPLAVAAWLRETGDFAWLGKPLPYLDGPAEPIWTHLLKGVTHLFHDRSERGLCRIRFADWNDALDGVGRQGRGDSTMVTMSLVCALRDLQAMATASGRALPYETRAWIEELAAALEKHAWTGEYYLRGYRDDGQPYGAPANREGRIYLNAQTWAILSGVAPRARWRALMDVTEKYLETPYGLKLVWPSYTHFDPLMGRISATLPGVYENGGTYNHAAAFYLHAALEAGEPERAWRHLRVMLPDSEANPSDRTGVEPFVLTNCIFGAESGHRAGTSYFGWWTGTAAWVLRLLHNGFTGLVPEFDGLHVRPEWIPPSLGLRAVDRTFRGTRYRVSIDPNQKDELRVDGRPADRGQPLPIRPGAAVRGTLKAPRTTGEKT
jgi:cellobiose phosphorylase